MAIDLDSYNTVPDRITEFRAKYPEGSLQKESLEFVVFDERSWVVYTAAAYRTPDDVRPGHGTAWEPVPGKTQFTRDSELQNAETSAWGRAIVAVLAADTRKGIASYDEVRSRQEEAPIDPLRQAQLDVWATWKQVTNGAGDADGMREAYEQHTSTALIDATIDDLRSFGAHLIEADNINHRQGNPA